MRVLIMSDMEGVSGIVTWDWVGYGSPMYQEGRKLYTQEINAAVRGALAAGATEIVVVDCHGAGGDMSFNSLIPEDLHPDCEFVAHHTWGRYTELLEKGCDAALMVGMHARAGTPDGVMCHTISSTTWRSVWFNDDEVGEFGINAALCGHYGCPVVLVTGDEATSREAREIMGDGIECVSVKKGLTRFSARQVPPVRARKMIEAGAKKALLDLPKKLTLPYIPDKPTKITVHLSTVDTAAKFKGRPGVELVDPLRVVSTAEDWMTAWNQIWHY